MAKTAIKKSTRQARGTGLRGRPWKKGEEDSTPVRLYDRRRAKEYKQAYLEQLKRVVAAHSDAAALVQYVRECQEDSLPLPAWVVLALESLVVSYVALATGRPSGAWTKWAKRGRRAFLDQVIAAHLQNSRDFEDLTWAEAADEASDWFLGSVAAGSPAAMLAAYKRNAKRPVGRPLTAMELRSAHKHWLIVKKGHSEWWSVNHSRLERDGTWRERPQLIYRSRSRATSKSR